MHINYAAELSVWCHFMVALVALSVSYVTVMGMVFKHEGGLYEEHMIPATVTDDMRRARRYFLKLVFATVAITCVGAYGLHLIVDPATFANFVWPSVGGILFSMLYASLTRYDRIRPRNHV